VSLVLVEGKEKMLTRAEAMTLAVMPALKKIHSESPSRLAMVDRLHLSTNQAIWNGNSFFTSVATNCEECFGFLPLF
jgi:hypothetical protein